MAAIEAIKSLPISTEELRRETSECSHLQTVIKFMQTSWPQIKKQVSDTEAADYFNLRGELQVVNNCLFLGDRPVIPPKLRKRILEDLHEGHPGASRMQALARQQCFWPGFTDQINAYVQRCNNCAVNAKAPRKEVLHPWPRPSRPWERLHIDFAGPMEGDFFFIIVDAFSNWPEIVRMRSTTAEKTVEALKDVFSRWGPCRTIVSDNGPQFISSTFKDFCKLYAIEHITSAPYHPQSNGRAERFVDIMKTGLKKLEGEGSTDEKLRTFLVNYRRTPSYTLNGQSPFEVMTGRRMPSRIDRLLAPEIKKRENSSKANQMAQQFDRHHGAKDHAFSANEPVFYKLHQGNAWKWHAGTIIKREGAANYQVKVGERIIKAHTNQLKHRFTNDFPLDDDSSDLPLINDFYTLQKPIEEAIAQEAQDEEDQGLEENSSMDSFHSMGDELGIESQPEEEIQEEVPEPLPIPAPPVQNRPQRVRKQPEYLKNYILSIIENYVVEVISNHHQSE
jgi:transposase InsO family protein